MAQRIDLATLSLLPDELSQKLCIKVNNNFT